MEICFKDDVQWKVVSTYLATEKTPTVNYEEYRDRTQHIVQIEASKQKFGSRPDRNGNAKEVEEAGTSSNKRRTTSFLAKKTVVFLIRYLAICFYADPTLNWFLPPGSAPWSHEDYAPSKRAFLSRILLPRLFNSASNNLQPLNSRDVLIRFYLGLDQIIPDYLLLSALHDLCAIFFVATGIDQPDEWPPFFGSITEAFTIRNYWGRFWHHLIYRSYSAHATAFSSNILHIKTGTSTSRYINNTLTFILSGLSHVIADMVMPGPKCRKWLVLVWYGTQMVAMVVEELMQKSWAKLEAKLPLGPRGRSLMVLIRRMVGYCWVFAFLSWISVQTTFPAVWCMRSTE